MAAFSVVSNLARMMSGVRFSTGPAFVLDCARASTAATLLSCAYTKAEQSPNVSAPSSDSLFMEYLLGNVDETTTAYSFHEPTSRVRHNPPRLRLPSGR